jgi:hypothetical protein
MSGASTLAPAPSSSLYNIPRCTACGAAIVELVDPAHPDGPRYVAVEADPGVVGETYYRPARHRRHVCGNQR